MSAAVDRSIAYLLSSDRQGLGTSTASSAISGGLQLIGGIVGEAAQGRAERRAFYSRLREARSTHGLLAQQEMRRRIEAPFPWTIVAIGGGVVGLTVVAALALSGKKKPEASK